MRPAVTVIPESFSPTRFILPAGSAITLERQPVWARFHALVTAPAEAREGEVLRAQREAEAIFAEQCRAACRSSDATAETAAREITRLLRAANLIGDSDDSDGPEGRRLSGLVVLDRNGRWSAASVGRTSGPVALVTQGAGRGATVAWIDDPSQAIEVAAAEEAQALVAFEWRERGASELKAGFVALVERLGELMVPAGTLGGLRLPLLALAQGLPLVEDRLLESHHALIGLMAESHQTLGRVKEALPEVLSQLRVAAEETGGAAKVIDRARAELLESADEFRRRQAGLVEDVTLAGVRFGDAAAGIDGYRTRLEDSLDRQLAALGAATERISGRAESVELVDLELSGAVDKLRDGTATLLEQLAARVASIETMVLQSDSLETAVMSATSAVSDTEKALREQARDLGEFAQGLRSLGKRLDRDVEQADAVGRAADRLIALADSVEPLRGKLEASTAGLDEVAAGVRGAVAHAVSGVDEAAGALRAALDQTTVRVDEAAVGLLDSLRAKSRLFEGYLADGESLKTNLAAAVTAVTEGGAELRGRAQTLDEVQAELVAAARRLSGELAVTEGAASWTRLLDESKQAARAQLDGHRDVRAALTRLDEAAQLSALGLEEMDSGVEALKAKVTASAAAATSLSALVEPALDKLAAAVDGLARSSQRFDEGSRAAEALSERLPELDDAVAALAEKTRASTERTDAEARTARDALDRIEHAARDVEDVTRSLVAPEGGVATLLAGADRARAGLDTASELLSEEINRFHAGTDKLSELTAATSLRQSEARISEIAERLEELFEGEDGAVETCREELVWVTGQLKTIGGRIDATAGEIDGLKTSLARSIARLNERLASLGERELEALTTREAAQPSWLRWFPLYATALGLVVLGSAGLVVFQTTRAASPAIAAATQSPPVIAPPPPAVVAEPPEPAIAPQPAPTVVAAPVVDRPAPRVPTSAPPVEKPQVEAPRPFPAPFVQPKSPAPARSPIAAAPIARKPEPPIIAAKKKPPAVSAAPSPIPPRRPDYNPSPPAARPSPPPLPPPARPSNRVPLDD